MRDRLSSSPSSEQRLAAGTDQEWSIGVWFGDSPFQLAPPTDRFNPVLTREDISDLPAAFVADPFLLLHHGTWHMFFEVLPRFERRGVIGVSTSADGISWTYQGIVLSEPFHLSYPYVFEWDGEYYMIPETHEVKAVRLYRAAKFPGQWSFVETLLSGHRYVDSSVCHFGGAWWLLAGLGARPMRAGVVRLYSAHTLFGPWTEHRRSPIVADDRSKARPAGRLLVSKDRVIRFAQNCIPEYGTSVRAFEVTRLSPMEYDEHELAESPVLQGSGHGWNAGGMHHIDPHPLGDGRWIAAVDGWRRPKDEAGSS